MARSASRRRNLVDLTPLRESPAFARLWFGNAVAGIGTQMTVVAVGLHVYELTHSTFAVAMVGGVALIPMLFAGLYGGMLADAFDRRRVALISATIAWAATATIALLAWFGMETVTTLYLLTALNTSAGTVLIATRQAIVPRLVGVRLLPSAAALNGMSFGVAVTVGPAVAGVLVAVVGFAWTYTVDVVLFAAAFAGIVSLPRIVPEGETRRPGWTSLKTGLGFLRRAPNIRASFWIDIAAMTFGRPHALFPAVGALLLGGGAITVGILTSAGAVGVIVGSLFSGQAGNVRWQGRAIGLSVVAYGVFTSAFGLVLLIAGAWPTSADIAGANWLGIALSSVALAGAGASDNVSMIFRNTMIVAAVPDNMRGRLQGVFIVVAAGGPRVGDVYIGLVVVGSVLWFPPLLGGILIIALVLAIMRFTSISGYDAEDPRP
ncbi:MAG TPA: MFS transporter [Terrimesophilobacter sp.]|nr:MFS transporter [Terrimesophilobacter sp.]